MKTKSIELNKEQRDAAETLEGPLLIVAGPGTGKTQLLSSRAAGIMKRKKIPGENILILTYTNAAAKSVKERLAKIVGFEGYRVTAETFHGFANSIILDSEEASAHIKERVQMTNIEKVKSLEYILDHFSDRVKSLRPFGYPYLYASEIAKRISELKNEGITPVQFEKEVSHIAPDGIHVEKKHVPRLQELSFIYKKYEELKGGHDKNIFDERGRYDYDDMIMIAIEILEKEPDLKASYIDRYRYIMVDEFQDTNGAQLKLLFTLLREKSPNLCCVGDDDQSIYRFQGASIANFKILRDRFPKVKVVRLKDNYRSTKDIISLSANIIKQIPRGERLTEPKELVSQKTYKDTRIEFVKFSTEAEEILYIIKKVKEIKKIIERSPEIPVLDRKKPYNHIAILVRKRTFILKMIDSFLKVGIPYATDGKEDISCQKRVRQMQEVLKLARPGAEDETIDLSLYKVLSSDFFCIPQQDILRFIDFANPLRKKSLTSLFTEFLSLFKVGSLGKRPSDLDTKNLPGLKKLSFAAPHKMHLASWAIQRLLEDSGTRPVHDLLMGFVEDSALYKFITKEYDKKRILLIRDLRSLTSFINMVKNLSLARPDLSLNDFLDEIETMKTHNMALEGQLVTATQDGVRIITAHASKGLEFHTCFIPFCIQDKSWPLKPLANKIPLPPGMLKSKEKAQSKPELAKLSFFDETRLFYVASSRAKSNLIFTSSPTVNTVESSFFNNLGIDLEDSKATEETLLKEFFEKGSAENDFLENTRDVLRDIIKNLVLTPTKLNNYLRCKRKFFYSNLLLLPGRKNQSLVFGNCAHKALEDTYLKFKRENKFPDFTFFKSSFERELRFQGVNKPMQNWCLTKLDDLKAWFAEVRKKPTVPIDLEKKKIITLKNGIIFTGKYDKVEFENRAKGLIRIIDYKTGSPDGHVKRFDTKAELISEECDDYFRQLVAYKMLYERDTCEPTKYSVSHGVLVFLEPVKITSRKLGLEAGDFVNKKVAITDAMVAELESVIYQVWKQISDLDFDKLPKRDPKKCRSCTFNSMCWEG